MSNKKLELFKPEDFYTFKGESFVTPDEAARDANAKLNKLIEAAPVVYGRFGKVYNSENENECSYPFEMADKDKCTHKARLMFIEELPPKECEHEPETILATGHIANPPLRNQLARIIPICIHCGIELEATWKAKS